MRFGGGMEKKTVNIGGLLFTIKYYKKFPKNILDDLGKDTIGYCDWSKQEIGILFRENRQLEALILFHEIGHAAADSVKTKNGLANENFAKPFFQIFFGALVDIGLISPKLI